jgi:C4-dicarboxylate-specific signal transduction histidine kinase
MAANPAQSITTAKAALRDLGQPRRLVIAAIASALVIAAAGWAAFEIALAGAIAGASSDATRRLALFDRTLEAMIERFHYLPATIAQAEQSGVVLERPGDAQAITAANGFLSKLNETAGADELFVMDRRGSVVAASNWWTLDSLVGEDFSFRPYFAEAMFDGAAKYYAFGIATSVPGYFLSQRIDGPDGPLGVAVTKINLGEIEANWWRSGELIGILDLNDVVILSTRPDWRYRPLTTIAEPSATRTAAEQRYGDAGIRNEGIAADIWPSRGARFAYIEGNDAEASGYFILDEQRLPAHGWRLVSFTPLGPLFRGAWTAAAAAALGTCALILIAALLVQRQRIAAQRLADHDRLEQHVAERTEDLHITNEQLRAEIAERIRAERDRRDAQASLVQAAKLASLGQALAGVAHEVSQPVAALSTHIASAKFLAAQRGDAQIGSILSTMDKVLDRLSALTGHLKTFARKETNTALTADAVASIANGLALIDHKLKAFDIAVRFEPPPAPLMVMGNPVHLEQVLINLFSNAADAMQACERRELSIALTTAGPRIGIAVSDTGEGIDPAEIPNLFDPFYTTKQAGRGLGLGLSISYGLIRDIGGAIAVESRLGTGSTFTITLPLAATASIARQEEPA